MNRNSKEYREWFKDMGYSQKNVDKIMLMEVKNKLKYLGFNNEGIERIMKNNYGSGIFTKKRNLKFEEKVFEAYEKMEKDKEKISKLSKKAEK